MTPPEQDAAPVSEPSHVHDEWCDPRCKRPAWPSDEAARWRVGTHYSIHVYEGDRPVATFHTVPDAARAVADHNGAADRQRVAREAVDKALAGVEALRGEPETVCRRCGGPNVWSWHAPSPVWNAVMRADDDLEHTRWSIICPSCFADLAEAKGFHHAIWHFEPHDGWETRVPLVDGEGRWWDHSRCLWVEPAAARERAGRG